MGRERGRQGEIVRRIPVLVALVLAAALMATMPWQRSTAAETHLDAEEQAFLELINDYRVANDLNPLSLDAQLQAAARWMSEDMAAKDYLSHTDSLGRDPFQRMADFGYTYNTWKGENLAAGIASAQAVFELWKGSSGHNDNMVTSNVKVIGIARAYGPGTAYGWYWTTDFGGQGDTPPPPEPISGQTGQAPGWYRPTDKSWHLKNSYSSGPSDITFVYGDTTVVPVTGDWDGDGDDTPGWYRPSDKSWHLKNSYSSGPSDIAFVYGDTTVVPVTGDWDGDGDDTPGWYRPSDKSWHLKNSYSSGPSDIAFVYGDTTVDPVIGDWDGQ